MPVPEGAGGVRLETVAEATGVRFGTSGVRGRVADLSDQVCRAYTQAFLRLLGASASQVLIGRDLRPSSPGIARACAGEALRHGLTPVNAGVLPTPALALAAQSRGVPAIMVTGSHIPFDRNGIKFYLPSGEITKEDERRMLATPVSVEEALQQPALPEEQGSVLDLYRARYLDFFGPGSLDGMRVGVYEHSSAARDLMHQILRGLGAWTVGLGRSDGFVPVDTEAVSDEDRELGRRWARELRLDAILTTDGDADRPLMADETGEWLRGDVLGILCARELGARTVVTPVSSNTALEACGAFPATVRTRIGSPHVIAAIEAAEDSPVVGYEANGGFLLGHHVTQRGRRLSALKTRDSVLPMLMVLAAARRQGCRVSGLVEELPARHTFSDRLQEVDVNACRALLSSLQGEPSRLSEIVEPGLGRAVALDVTDGLRSTFQTGEIVHLRLSGNAPELRCYTEAGDPQRARQLCRSSVSRLQAFSRPQGT